MDGSGWVDPNTHGWIVRPRTDQDWAALAEEYGGCLGTPLIRCLDTVRANGCTTVVVENRYVDSDYRSEFVAFWSQRFDGMPAFTRRLHFFANDVAEASLHRIEAGSGYLGYAVMRPVKYGPVGRTMLKPPPALRDWTFAVARDHVTLFGNKLEVEAAPFCQQDGEFL